MHLVERNNSCNWHIWRSEVEANDFEQSFSLIDELKQGRYLIEPIESPKICPTDYIYLWILNEDALVERFKVDMECSFKEININLNSMKTYKKLMYSLIKVADKKSKPSLDLKNLNNDLNLTNLSVSKNYFHELLTKLDESNKNLCASLRKFENFNFAII
jgi:hypothetical protein